jgi:hypothetical protein
VKFGGIDVETNHRCHVNCSKCWVISGSVCRKADKVFLRIYTSEAADAWVMFHGESIQQQMDGLRTGMPL